MDRQQFHRFLSHSSQPKGLKNQRVGSEQSTALTATPATLTVVAGNESSPAFASALPPVGITLVREEVKWLVPNPVYTLLKSSGSHGTPLCKQPVSPHTHQASSHRGHPFPLTLSYKSIDTRQRQTGPFTTDPTTKPQERMGK